MVANLAALLASFIGLALKTYSIPINWTVGNELLRHTLGAVGGNSHIAELRTDRLPVRNRF